MPSFGTWRNLRNYAPSGAPILKPPSPSMPLPVSSACGTQALQEPLSLSCAPPGRASPQVPQEAPVSMHPSSACAPAPCPYTVTSSLPQPFVAALPPPISLNPLAPRIIVPHLSPSQVLPEERDDGISVMDPLAPHLSFPSLALRQPASPPLPPCSNPVLMEPTAPRWPLESPGASRAPLPLYSHPPIPYPSCILPSPSQEAHPSSCAPT